MMAWKMVGTPGIMVGRSLLISFSVSMSSNLGTRIISMPWLTPKFITVVMAKTWNRGRMPMTRSFCGPCGRHALTWATLMERLAWVSMAPLGVPVVPPVYCSTATASGVSAGRS